MAATVTKTAEGDSIVKRYMLGAFAVGLVPLPLVDVAALSGVQLKMLHSLSNLYGVEFSSHLGKPMIASLLGGSIPVSLSSHVASLVKGIPVYGQLTGMVSRSIFGGASTYAIGKVFIQHFESGGTFLTFDPRQVSDYYADQFEKGRQEVRRSFVGIKP